MKIFDMKSKMGNKPEAKKKKMTRLNKTFC